MIGYVKSRRNQERGDNANWRRMAMNRNQPTNTYGQVPKCCFSPPLITPAYQPRTDPLTPGKTRFFQIIKAQIGLRTMQCLQKLRWSKAKGYIHFWVNQPADSPSRALRNTVETGKRTSLSKRNWAPTNWSWSLRSGNVKGSCFYFTI